MVERIRAAGYTIAVISTSPIGIVSIRSVQLERMALEAMQIQGDWDDGE